MVFADRSELRYCLLCHDIMGYLLKLTAHKTEKTIIYIVPMKTSPLEESEHRLRPVLACCSGPCRSVGTSHTGRHVHRRLVTWTIRVFREIIIISMYRCKWKDGGHGSVLSVSEFKPDNPGFDPLAGRGERQCFCLSESTRVQTCLCLTPLRVYGTHPNLCAR